MNTNSIVLAALAAAWAAPASAAGARFDTADAKGPGVTLLESVRRASSEGVPAVGAVKAEPVFWGRDGRWCPDGQVYRGGPCDNTGGGYYPPAPPPYPRPPYPPSDGGRGLEAARAVCRDMFTDRDKLACRRSVRSARFFDPDGVRVCRGMFTDRDKLACLETIADSAVGRETARFCGGLFTDSDKLRCLREQAGERPPYPPDHGYPDEACGGINSFGAYYRGGGCNSLGCWRARGGCNSFGCWRGGGCNSFGCWDDGGQCNSFGCIRETSGESEPCRDR